MNYTHLQKLQPHCVHKVWEALNYPGLKVFPRIAKPPLGETWEISCHRNGASKDARGSLIGRYDNTNLPYLVKLIDTGQHLSVQVHPDDEYAAKNESSQGKTECWLVLEAGKDAGIYLGLKSGVTKNEFESALKSSKAMDQFLRFYPVKSGDFFYVPAGTIHAIGKDVMLAEVQQSSGITYRVWDWNRVDANGLGRELHIEQALEVINFDSSFNHPDNFKYRQGLLANVGVKHLVEHPQFKLDLIVLEPDSKISINTARQTGRVASILNLHSSVVINGEELEAYQAALLEDVDSLEISSARGGGVLLIQ